MSRFANLVKERRKALGWTQQQLGEAAGGVSYSNISNFESGRADVQASTLERLLTALGWDWSRMAWRVRWSSAASKTKTKTFSGEGKK